MSRRIVLNMKKINITTALLCAYIIVMGVLYWPGRNPLVEYTNYYIALGGAAFITVVLRIIQIKRLKLRDRWRKENEDKTLKK